MHKRFSYFYMREIEHTLGAAYNGKERENIVRLRTQPPLFRHLSNGSIW